MADRTVLSSRLFVAALFATLCVSTSMSGQTAGAKAAAPKPRPATAAPRAGAWTRTTAGQPDLQGTWVNFDSTPFEEGADRHPEREYGARQFPELITLSKSAVLPPRRRSMVQEPDGKVPILAWAEEKRDYNAAHGKDSWTYQTTWERCITRGVPGGIFPGTYDSAYQIVQGPGFVAILYEMIHEPRIIPVDGSPHLPKNVRLWNGDSRGHWEGNTLVVDITNYTDKGQISTGTNTGRVRGLPQSESLHVVERFTRVDADTIDYEALIDDPKVYAHPWKVSMPLTLDNTYQIFEYACHEGNRGYMETNLSGGRAEDAEAAKKKKKPGQ